jgi:ATP-binding cassette, subfamily B, bacterial
VRASLGELRTAASAGSECFRSARPHCLALTLLAALAGVLTPVSAGALRRLLDALTGNAPAARSYLAAGLIVGCGVTGAVLPIAQRWLQAGLGRRVQRQVTVRLYQAVSTIEGLAPFEDPGFRDRIRLAQQASVSAPPQVLSGGLTTAQSIITAVSFGVLLAQVDVSITVLVLTAAIPQLISSLFDARRQAEFAIGVAGRMRRGMFFGTLLTDSQAVKEIRLYEAGDFLLDRLLGQLDSVQREEQRLNRRINLRQGGMLALAAIGSGLALFRGVQLALAHQLTVGEVSLLLAGTIGVQAALAGVVGQLAQLRQAALLFDTYLQVRDQGPDLPRLAAVTGGGPAPVLEFRNVWFRYGDDTEWAVQDVSFSIAADEAVALVGRNGAGKSTVVKLICRFYDPQRGSIRWRGVDIRTLPVRELRQQLGAVFQDFMSYDLTARENIELGDRRRAGDHEAVVAAATAAGADQFLHRLPAGFDTMLSRAFLPDASGSSATYLSGGQWQRVAIARAFMRLDRPLLLLDEPSAGLDPESEQHIHRTILAAAAGRASLLISHRLSAVRTADRILVLDDGRIVESGSHRELMAADSQYRALFVGQAAGYRLDGADLDSVVTTTPHTAATGHGPNARESQL